MWEEKMGRGRGGIRRKRSNKGKEEVAVGNRKNKGKRYIRREEWKY